eukprot:SAG22_NODE_2445_length_2564_cov_3.456795_2_plen_223_part_00
MPAGQAEWEFGLCECCGVGRDIGGFGGEVQELTKRTRVAAIGQVRGGGGRASPAGSRADMTAHSWLTAAGVWPAARAMQCAAGLFCPCVVSYFVGHYLLAIGSDARPVPCLPRGGVSFGLSYLACPCIVGYELRGALRRGDDIDGSYLQDVVCMWCLGPCNLCQMLGHVRRKAQTTAAGAAAADDGEASHASSRGSSRGRAAGRGTSSRGSSRGGPAVDMER